MVTMWLSSLMNLAVYVLLAPLAVGFLRWSKARLQLRCGPNPLQPYRDLWKLWRTGPRDLATPSWVFAVAPYVSLWCYVIIGAALPVLFLPGIGGHSSGGPASSSSDVLFLIMVVGLSTFVTALGSMDSGAPFGHMGSSRTMFTHVLVEVGLVLSLAALAALGSTTDLVGLVVHVQQLGTVAVLAHPALALVGVSLGILALAEAARLPFDNPGTHLELTMGERAMHLEYSGRQWGALETTEALKLLFLLTLLIDLLAPSSLAPLSASIPALALSVIAYPVKLIIALLLLALWESLRGQLRMRRAILPLSIACGLATCSIFLSFVGRLLAGGF